MPNRYLLPAVALAVILVGCAPAPPPPAPDTRAADAQAIRDLEKAWEQSFATKDADKIAVVYADDASALLPNMPVINGVPAIKTALKAMVEDKNFAITFAATKVEVSKASDVAYSQGAYSMTMTDPKTKKAVTEKGKYVTAYKKQADGSWKVATDILNGDGPPEPAK